VKRGKCSEHKTLEPYKKTVRANRRRESTRGVVSSVSSLCAERVPRGGKKKFSSIRDVTGEGNGDAFHLKVKRFS